MSNYRSTSTVIFHFDGDTVTAKLGRVSFEDALAMRDTDGKNAAEITRKYVKSISGLKDADGEDVPLEAVFTDFYFSPLVLEMTMKVLETGTIQKGDERPFGER